MKSLFRIKTVLFTSIALLLMTMFISDLIAPSFDRHTEFSQYIKIIACLIYIIFSVISLRNLNTQRFKSLLISELLVVFIFIINVLSVDGFINATENLCSLIACQP